MTETAICRVLSELRRTSTRIIGLSRGKNSEFAPALHCGVVGQVGRHVTIDILPDDVLLEIFDFDRLLALKSWNHPQLQTPWSWQRLAHVCQGWRSLVFASPRRLQLRLYDTTSRKPVTQNPSCWPPSLPIAIWYPPGATIPTLTPNDEDNFFAVLEQRDRIGEINLAMTPALFERLTALRQGPFPALEHLRLISPDSAYRPLLLPSTFLGPSAPRLRDIQLVGVAFPTLPDFLLSTRDLASLQLINIPNTNLFSVEMLVNHLPGLTHLKSLEIRFDSWTDASGPLPSITPDHGVLQSLTELRFKGVCGYLEYLVARLDAPFLQKFSIEFFDQPSFDTPKLAQFISHTEGLRSPCEMTIELTVSDVAIVQQFQESPCQLRIGLGIPCCALGRRVDSLSNICRHLLSFLPNVEQLEIKAFYFSSSASRPHEQMVDSTQWLELFRSFPGVKALGVSGALVRNIASALERATTGEAAKDVFPALCVLRFNGNREYMSEIVESFVAARHPSDLCPSSTHRIRRGEGWFDYGSEDDQLHDWCP